MVGATTSPSPLSVCNSPFALRRRSVVSPSPCVRRFGLRLLYLDVQFFSGRHFAGKSPVASRQSPVASPGTGNYGQKVGRKWAQIVGRLWANCGEIVGRLWAESGQKVGRPFVCNSLCPFSIKNTITNHHRLV